MGKGSGGTNTVVQNTAPPPQVMQAYQSVLAQANALAQQPQQQYGGNMIAGFTPQQLAAMQEINQAQGSALPYLNTAAQYAGFGAAPVFPNVMQYNSQNLQGFIDPYTQQVTSGLQSLFDTQNQEQQQSVVGNAISAGAWGGDRASVAQAELARQQQLAQNPQLAQVLQQGFGQAQNTLTQQQNLQLQGMEGDAWRAANAAYQFGGLGSQVQSNLLGGASALMQSGALGQQLNQEALNIPYEQFAGQQAYPFQTLSWLDQIATGVGSGMGGTGTTTSPGVSTLSQLGGLGLAGLGLAGQFGLFGSGAGATAAGLSAADASAIAGVDASLAGGTGAVAAEALPALAASRGGRFAFGGRAHGTSNIIPFPRNQRSFGMRFDDGGGVAPNPSAGPPVAMGDNPMAASLVTRYRGMSTEQLQRLAIMSPPNTAQGQVIQKLLQARHMAPGSTTPAPATPPQPQGGFGMLPVNDNSQPQPMAARGGRYASGGGAGPSVGPTPSSTSSTIVVGDSTNPMPVSSSTSYLTGAGYGIPIPQTSFSVAPDTGNSSSSFWNPRSGWASAPAQPLAAPMTGTGFGGSNPSNPSAANPIVTPLPAAQLAAAQAFPLVGPPPGGDPTAALANIDPSAWSPQATAQVFNSPGFGGENMTPEQMALYQYNAKQQLPQSGDYGGARGGSAAAIARNSAGGGVLEGDQGMRFDDGGEVEDFGDLTGFSDADEGPAPPPTNPPGGFGRPPSSVSTGAGNVHVFQPSKTQQFLASPWGALTAAGAGMLASRSPHAGVALGEGLKTGLDFASKQGQEADRRAYEEAQIGTAQDRLHYEKSKPTINSSGDTVRLIYQDGRTIDLGIPTAAWEGKQAAEQHYQATEKHYQTQEDIERQRLQNEQRPDWAFQGNATNPETGQKGAFYINRRGTETRWGPAIEEGRGIGTGRTSDFETKRQAWLGIHPDDEEGALAFASGHKQLSPAEIRKSASSNALRSVQTDANNGAPMPKDGWDAEAKRRAAQWEQYLSGAGASPPGGGGGQPPTSSAPPGGTKPPDPLGIR